MHKKTDIQHPTSPTAQRVAQALGDLIQESLTGCLKEVPEPMVRLLTQVGQIERGQQQLDRHLASIKQALENLGSAHELLENAGKTNQMLGQEHYEQRIIEPMVRSLFPVFDLMADSGRHHRDLHPTVTGLLDAISTQLQQFIAQYDIEIIDHTAGESFDPKLMQPVEWKTTSEKQLDGIVAQSLQIGFRAGQTRILRMETVSLFKYQPSSVPTVTFMERTES